MNRFLGWVVAALLILLGFSAVAVGQDVSQDTRERINLKLDMKTEDGLMAASDIFTVLDRAVNHQTIPEIAMVQLIARANSKGGGMWGQATFAQRAAVFAVDFLRHEQEHDRLAKNQLELTEQQNQKIAGLEKKLADLSKDVEKARSSNAQRNLEFESLREKLNRLLPNEDKTQ